MKTNGIFITFEGGEGSGKSTQMAMLRAKFEETEILHLFLREPGGSLIGERVREILLDPDHIDLSPRAELLLYEAARAQVVDELIAPALEAGRVVVCDRFYDSTTAYQGFGRSLKLEDIRILNMMATEGRKPDLTLFFDIDPILGISRATTDGADRLEQEDISFHQRVREGYLWIAEQEPERVVVLDASGTIEEVGRKVITAVWNVLEVTNGRQTASSHAGS